MLKWTVPSARRAATDVPESGLPKSPGSERIIDMSYYRVSRLGCGGLLARSVLVVMMGIVALICVANRSWIEGKALNAFYGNRPQIHLGEQFTPGATAVEDGLRQTAVLIGGAPHVRVTSPTADWLRNHKDAVCKHDVCTAAATRAKFAGSGGIDFVGALAGLLLCFIVWTVLTEDDRSARGR
jgi:hypothetical protein